MIANDNKSYLVYLNKLADECSNTYHHSINKNFVNADYSALTERSIRILKLLFLKFMIELELLSIRIFLVKVALQIRREK